VQNQYSLKFKEASRTGSKCLWLKAIENCDCYDEDRLVDSEPDPKCPKCYGFGKIRQAILTDKIRNELNNSYVTQFEKTKFGFSDDLFISENGILGLNPTYACSAQDNDSRLRKI